MATMSITPRPRFFRCFEGVVVLKGVVDLNGVVMLNAIADLKRITGPHFGLNFFKNALAALRFNPDCVPA